MTSKVALRICQNHKKNTRRVQKTRGLAAAKRNMNPPEKGGVTVLARGLDFCNWSNEILPFWFLKSAKVLWPLHSLNTRLQKRYAHCGLAHSKPRGRQFVLARTDALVYGWLF